MYLLNTFFVAEQAKKLSVTPIITFDQPLYWKSVQIVANEHSDSVLKPIVVRLGAFHTQMSFLGCIGQLMQNSRLQETIETIYAPYTVTNMLGGKAVSRAVRSHFLVVDALNTLLIEQLFPSATISDLDCNTNDAANITDDEKSELEIIETFKTLIQGIYSEKIPTESVNENSCLLETLNRYVTLRESLKC